MVILQTDMQPGLLHITFSDRFLLYGHLMHLFGMVPPDRGLASAGQKASTGSLLAKSEDDCKPDGLYRVQMSTQADAMTCYNISTIPMALWKPLLQPCIYQRRLSQKSLVAFDAVQCTSD